MNSEGVQCVWFYTLHSKLLRHNYDINGITTCQNHEEEQFDPACVWVPVFDLFSHMLSQPYRI